jgi:hypothetical protein
VGPIAGKDPSDKREIPCYSWESILDSSAIQPVTRHCTNCVALQQITETFLSFRHTSFMLFRSCLWLPTHPIVGPVRAPVPPLSCKQTIVIPIIVLTLFSPYIPCPLLYTAWRAFSLFLINIHLSLINHQPVAAERPYGVSTVLGNLRMLIFYQYVIRKLIVFLVWPSSGTSGCKVKMCRSQCRTAWGRNCIRNSNAGIVGLNPTRGTDFSVHLFCVCVVLCAGSDLATGWSPIQGVLPPVYKSSWNWRGDQSHG